MADDKEKKIIVDEDWKKQAQEEKEKLAAEEKKQQQQPEEEKKLPEGDFKAILSMLATQAFFALGLIQVEGQDAKEPDLEVARYNIDMLSTLQEKTKGNLSEEESKILEDTLNQLRMVFVQLSQGEQQ